MKFKVTITPAGGSAFTLADDSVAVVSGSNFTNGAGGSCMNGFGEGEVDDMIQAVPLFRAPNQFVASRGNLIERFPLRVVRVHDNEINAAKFYFTHGASVPRAGLVQFTVTASSGTARFYLAGAVVGKISRPRHMGLRMEWTYPITAPGPWLTTAPS